MPSTPSARSLASFLVRMHTTACKHVRDTAGSVGFWLLDLRVRATWAATTDPTTWVESKPSVYSHVLLDALFPRQLVRALEQRAGRHVTRFRRLSHGAHRSTSRPSPLPTPSFLLESTERTLCTRLSCAASRTPRATRCTGSSQRERSLTRSVDSVCTHREDSSCCATCVCATAHQQQTSRAVPSAPRSHVPREFTSSNQASIVIHAKSSAGVVFFSFM